MPNHVTTICTVTGPDSAVRAFRAAHIRRDEKEKEADCFAFETIIPKPTCIDDAEDSSDADAGFYALTGLAPLHFAWSAHPMRFRDFQPGPTTSSSGFRAWLEQHHQDVLAKGQAQLRAFRETGHRNWHDWCVANWGTKWGAYSYGSQSMMSGRFVFKFDTAWAFPEPVFRKLAEMHPTLVFAIVSYDEGGNFACVGEFNGSNDYRKVPATDDLYERVYGHAPERDEDEAPLH